MSSRLIVITGAAKRIGRAIALKAAASENYNVLFTANTSTAEAELLVRDLEGCGVKAAFVQGDLIHDLDEVCRKVKLHDLVQECGGVDGLVHNASIFRAHPFDGEIYKLRKQLHEHTAIHLTAPYVLTQALLSPLQSKQGSIVAITDTSFGRAWNDLEAYSASKAALRQLVTNLAGSKSLTKHGVRANCVSPGFIMEAEQVDEDYEALLKKIPLGRMGTPEDIADAVLYFLNSRYTTGQCMSVCGGLSISS